MEEGRGRGVDGPVQQPPGATVAAGHHGGMVERGRGMVERGDVEQVRQVAQRAVQRGEVRF